MGKITVFYHGRPQGQKFWPTENLTREDSSYLEPFLDSKIGADASSVMVIDYANGNAYYSFVVRKNVIEKERGTESYFAITLKIEKAFCKNVSKLHSLLSLVYAEKCENALFSKENNGMRRYRINNFDEIEGVLSEARNILVANFEKVISPYVFSLPAGMDTSRANNVTKYSLKEADSAIFFEDCATCKVVVSADYPRRDIGLQQEIKKLEQEKVREREESEKKASQLQNQLTGKQHELERAVQQDNLLNIKILDLQSKIDSLKSAEEEIRKYKREAEDYKSRYNNKKSDCDKAEQEVSNLRQQLKKKSNASNERIIDTAPPIADRFQGGSEMDYTNCQKNNQNNYKKVWLQRTAGIAWALLFVATAIAAIFSVLTYFHSSAMSKDVKQELPQELGIQECVLQSPVQHQVVSLKHGEQGFKIDITGNPSDWKSGLTANMNLLKDSIACRDVEWKVSGSADLDPNGKSAICFTQSGPVTIEARKIGAETDTVIQRNIDAK